VRGFDSLVRGTLSSCSFDETAEVMRNDVVIGFVRTGLDVDGRPFTDLLKPICRGSIQVAASQCVPNGRCPRLLNPSSDIIPTADMLKENDLATRFQKFIHLRDDLFWIGNGAEDLDADDGVHRTGEDAMLSEDLAIFNAGANKIVFVC